MAEGHFLKNSTPVQNRVVRSSIIWTHFRTVLLKTIYQLSRFPPMPSATTETLRARVERLRTELVDLAFTLDVRGSCAAADVAMTTAARLAELCEELSPPHREANLNTRPALMSRFGALVR